MIAAWRAATSDPSCLDLGAVFDARTTWGRVSLPFATFARNTERGRDPAIVEGDYKHP